VRFSPSRNSALAASIFCALVVVLALGHHRPAEHVSKPAAESFALRNPEIREHLAHHGWDRVRTTPLDDRLLRVTFFNGPRVVLEAAVAPDGRVANRIPYSPGYVRIGGQLAQDPLVLALLVLVFLVATASAPLRTMRNLDMLALVAFVLPVVLMNARLLEASVYASYPPLAYLCIRCAYVAFRAPVQDVGREPLVPMTRRSLALAVAGAGVAFAVLAIPAGLVGDVAFASMAGATDVIHGTLPYGHLSQSEVVHGDTYPLLAYAAYVPAAILTPVKSGFDQLDGALWVAVAFALAGAAAMYRMGGWRLALAWLTFPPVLIAASAGSNDIVAAACVAWAAALIVHAGRSTLALAIAGWVKLGPLVVLPAWIARERGRSLTRAALAATAATAGVIGWVLALGGLAGLGDMVDAVSFQAQRGSLLSLWALTGSDAAQVAVQAAVATLVVAGVAQVRRDPTFAADPRRVAALAAALLLGTQLAANYWSYTYLTWAFPLVALALLRAPRATPAQARRQALRPEAHP
jgi:hypothetical protein